MWESAAEGPAEAQPYLPRHEEHDVAWARRLAELEAMGTDELKAALKAWAQAACVALVRRLELAAELDAAELDVRRPRPVADAAELAGLKPKDLRKRAAAAGADPAQLERVRGKWLRATSVRDRSRVTRVRATRQVQADTG